jgi:hypothetical protein
MSLVTWPKVLRCLGRDETRSWALSQIRDAGITGDSFGSKTSARQTVCEVLIRTEDWLEGEHRQWPERDSIRKTRRQLEQELWP